MKDPYPSEKFGKAVDTLLVTDELLGGRIRDAFEFDLCNIRPGEHTLPDDVARQLHEYKEAINQFGSPAAWVGSLDDVTKQRIARWILESYEALEREFEAA